MVTVYEADESDVDVFEYVKGGREGVKKRFGDIISTGLKDLPLEARAALAVEFGYAPGLFNKIADGDYSMLKWCLIDYFSDVFDFGVEDRIGSITIPAKEKSKLLTRINQEGFCCPVAATQSEDVIKNPQLTEEQLIAMYVLSRIAHEL